MDDLYNLINQTFDKKMNSLNLIKAVPCKVVNVFENETAEVELISNKTKYTVPNYSGSKLNVGETVQLFYKGLITNNNAYIGASFNKESIVEIEKDVFRNVSGKIIIGGTLSSGSTIWAAQIISDVQVNCLLSINMEITGLYDGTVTIKSTSSRTAISYAPTISVSKNQKTHFSFTIPINILSGTNVIDVKCYGEAYVDSARCCVSGMNIRENIPYLSSSDYIYNINRSTSTSVTNVIYYKGTNLNPEIPDTMISGTGKLLAISFDHSNVQSVRIPEGITEIE